MPTFRDPRFGSAITVKVQPRAKKTEVIGFMEDGTVRIRLAAVPEDGKANEALIEFLAETLGLTKKQVDIVAGLSGEKKLVSLVGISPTDAEEKLNAVAHEKKRMSD